MSGQLVLALDFGGTKIAAAVADADGRRVVQQATPTDPLRPARWNLEQGVALGRQLIARAGGEEPAAVGASTFGVPTPAGVLLAPAIPGWDELSLAEELAAAFDCEAVAVANDVKAAASAEARSGALVGADPGIYVNLGTGLAVAVVCGGEVVRGAHGAAGEIGYHLRQPADVDEGPDPDRLLEQVASGMALTALAARETGEHLGAAEVFGRESGNAAFSAGLDALVRELSFHLVNLAITLDPARVAVGGGMVRSWSRLEPALRRALRSFVPFPPELVLGAYPFDAPLAGAIALALETGRQRPSRREPVLHGALRPGGGEDCNGWDKDQHACDGADMA